ncbi:MAG: response regulator [Mucilaginibacter sp.]|nr:response regulator [Mucilaginibacter sp.]
MSAIDFKTLTFIKNYKILDKKVLIIENDEDIRHIVEFILQEQGFKTLSIPEPEDLSEIIPFAPNVILLDEFINSKPGHRLCRKIKQVAALAAIPVIILSTANDIELIAAECEANDHIRKPFEVEDIVDKVVRMVNHQPLAF